MPITTLSLLVKGADHRNKRGPSRRFEIAMCSPGEPVSLEHEPDNAFDPNAVRIMSARGIQIGYVAAERAPWIGAKLRDGDVQAIFQEATREGAIIRVSLDGLPPALPLCRPSRDPAQSADDESGFYPDPDYPDD